MLISLLTDERIFQYIRTHVNGAVPPFAIPRIANIYSNVSGKLACIRTQSS